MKKFETLIAKLLLFGYLITGVVPALPAESLKYLSTGKIKKECKKSYAVSQKNQHTPFQPAFSSAEKVIKEVPQAALLSACGPANTYLPPRSVSEITLFPQQEKDYAAFAFRQYIILFQEPDPDPPKASFC